MRCECGCGWEGEDEVTQYLVEECAMLILDVVEARAEERASEEMSEAREAQERHARLLEMAARQVRG